jgi:hypothetical protein
VAGATGGGTTLLFEVEVLLLVEVVTVAFLDEVFGV